VIKNQLNDSFKKQIEAQSAYSKNKRLEKEKEEKTIASLMDAMGMTREETVKVMEKTRKDIKDKEAKKKNTKLNIVIGCCVGCLVMSYIIMFVFIN